MANFKYLKDEMVEVNSPKLGNFYGIILSMAPDREFNNYLIVITHSISGGNEHTMIPGNQAWVDEIYIIRSATILDASAHIVLTK